MAAHEGLDATLAADSLAILPRAEQPRALPRLDVDPQAIARLPVGESTVEDVLQRYHTRGVVVLHDGHLAFEWYAGDPARRRPCFSVTKSFTGTLAALAMHDGVLDPEARVGALLPDLAGGGFADATVRQVADMTVSIAYTEDYDTGSLPPGPADARTFGFNDYLAALRPDGPWTLRGLLARIGPGPHEHGYVFDYATPKTDVLGWALETARGRGYLELFRETVWDHTGAAHDGALAFGPCGTPMLAAGLTLSTADLARAGLALLEHIPPAVVASMRAGGDTEAFARSLYGALTGYAYADQWWLAGGPGRPLTAWGIHGQVLWLEPDAGIVIAIHCADPAASDLERDIYQDVLCRVLVDHLT